LKKRKNKLIIALLLFLSPFINAEEQTVLFTVEPGQKYRIIEKFNLSQYRNGQYQGHVYRENRGIYSTESLGADLYRISGQVYKLEEKTKEGFKTASAVQGQEDTSFTLSSKGAMLVPGTDYPRLRSFPTFPSRGVKPGDKWEGGLEVVVSSPDGSSRAVLPQYCEYTFKGVDHWEGREVFVIQAQYAVRYRAGQSKDADSFLKSLSGKHVVSLLIDKETREFLLMKDIMEEDSLYLDGSSLREKGFLLTFYKGIELLDRPGLSREVKTVLSDKLKESLGSQGLTLDDEVSVDQSEEGLSLNLKNLHFEPNLAVILPEDRPLLDSIASILKTIPDRTFFVKGHTADVGTMESQITLSEDRAKKIVDELVSRGINAERFLYSGLGGLEPLGDNATDEGRKQNRRVEILILED